MRERLLDFSRTIEVKDTRKFYLDDILTKEDYQTMMVRNRVVVLNKAECGNGGTTGIINYIKSAECKRGALILVPNRSIVISKEDYYKEHKDPDICCVYGGKDEIDINARIVIATYDQFSRLLSVLSNTGTSGEMFDSKFWAGRVIVVDEYHKLVDESKFREVMCGVTDLIYRTDEPVVLMSATPHVEYIETLSDILYEKKDIVPLNISYKITHKGDTKLDRAIAKRLEQYSRKMTKSMTMFGIRPSQLPNLFQGLISGSKKVCVFYNNVSKISQILKEIGTDECEILCSSDTKQKEKCGEYYSDKYNPEKRIHFMTSAYFTGHDIDEEVDNCYIIGSRQGSNTAISMRDMKQIIGRFRKYCGQTWAKINLMYINEKKNENEYKIIEKQLVETNFWLNMCGSDWVNDMEAIKMKLNNLRYQDIQQQFDYWSTPAKLIERLRKEGYIVHTAVVDGKMVDKPIDVYDLPDYVAEESLSFSEAFVKIANGEEVSWKDYRDVNKIIEYITRFGFTRNKRGNVVIPTRDKVFDYVKISNVFDEIESDFERLSEDDRYVAVGFEDCAIYKAKYLLNVLKYIQWCYPRLIEGELDYGVMPIKFKEVFGAIMFCDKEGRTKGSDLWCVMGHYLFDRLNDFTSNKDSIASHYTFSGSDLYRRQLPEKMYKTVKTEVKLSYMTRINKDNRCMAKTIQYNEIESVLNPLTGNRAYDWVNEDKKVRLYKMKMDLYDLSKLKEQIANWKEKIDLGGKLSSVESQIYNKISCKSEQDLKRWYHFIKQKQDDWKAIKNYEQTKVSEMHIDTTAEYRQSKSDLNETNSLIIDIDEGLSFSEFKEIYKQYKWYAYPTISNVNYPDWNKFRVIIPITNRVIIEGENKVRVLKALRNMFSPYEDRNHGLTSYINLNDFEHMYENEGEVYDVRQRDVDLLQHLVSVLNTYTTTKVDEKEKTEFKGGSSSSLINGTIKMFKNCEKNWNTTIYNRLWKLVNIDGFGRSEIDEIKAGVENNEFADYMEVVIRAHPEWGL